MSIYICMYVCMHVCMYIYTYIYVYIHIYIYIRISIYIYTHTNLYTYIEIHLVKSHTPDNQHVAAIHFSARRRQGLEDGLMPKLLQLFVRSIVFNKIATICTPARAATEIFGRRAFRYLFI